MKKVKLYNRYRYDVHLTEVAENKWELFMDKNASWYRLSPTNAPNELRMVDPSGGPYMAVGFEFDGKTVKKIIVENDKIYLMT